MKTIIKNVHAFLPDGTTPVTNILIDNDRIAGIGDIPEDFHAGKIIDGTNHFAIPGFVNAHTHTSMTLLRSYRDDMALMDWLHSIWPIEDKMTPDDIYWGAMLAMAEMIRTGTTTFADMYGPYMERVAEATIDAGLRGVLSRGIIGMAPDAETRLQSNVELFQQFNGAADGRITVMFGPHAPYTCPPAFLKKVASAAQQLGAEVHIHMHETLDEINDSLKEYGKRPFAWVEETGLFDGKGTLAAHCVHMDDNDIEIVKRHHIRVAHNPTSNMKLASGVAPVPRMLQEGICVALGTDGTSSNNNLDMLEEVNLAAMLHKVHALDPLAIPAAEALRMGTEYGATVVGVEGIGQLKAGYKADITLFSMDSLAWCPQHDLVSLLVYAASARDVDTVLVDGHVLLEKGEFTTLDVERIKFETQRCADRLTK